MGNLHEQAQAMSLEDASLRRKHAARVWMWNNPLRLVSGNTLYPAGGARSRRSWSPCELETRWRKWAVGNRHSGFLAGPHFLFTFCFRTVNTMWPAASSHLPSVMDRSLKPWARANPFSLTALPRCVAAREVTHSRGYGVDIIPTNPRSKPSKLGWCEVTLVGCVPESCIELSFSEATSCNLFLPCHLGRTDSMWSGHN